MHVRKKSKAVALSCFALLCSALLLSRPIYNIIGGFRRTLEARLVTEATGSAILQLRSSKEEEESRYRVLHKRNC